ncbi:MAG: DUF420 domain-containing protein [Planctomycetes bacterium]|nr:DUF420 domain-containing protein [Planctomycetota bacterium]
MGHWAASQSRARQEADQRTRIRFLTGAALIVLVLAGSASADTPDSLYSEVGAVKPFELVDAYGQPFRPTDLKGRVWIAHFFYRSCTEGCAQTTAAMKDLQDAFRGKPDVALVSINLDPETDAPTLKEYAESLGTERGQWYFLTGNADDIYQVVQTCFFQSAGRTGATDPGKAVMHTFNLMVVDQNGMIRGYASGKDPTHIPALIDRVRSLVRPRFTLPAVNASLNGLCAVLLAAGYTAIRMRRELLHKSIMLTALLVSAVFLGCYLYYHFVVLDGRPTRFAGEGWIRPVYFGILLTHTVLAAIVAPLAIFVAYQGLRDRRPRHVKVARWTLPIWFYVSVTGVVIYVLLYHVYPPI